MRPTMWPVVAAGLVLAAATDAVAQGTGTAFTLDGATAYAWRDPMMSGRSEGTVEAWVVFASDNPSVAIWSGGNGEPGVTGDVQFLGRQSPHDTNLTFATYRGFWQRASTSPPLTGRWVHVATTWDATGMRLYVDGTLASERSSPGVVSYNAEIIGASAWGYHFDGWIDELRLWDHARSELEIQSAMFGTLPPSTYESPTSGLVAYYQFESFEDLGMNGDGADDVRDLTPNGHHLDTQGGAGLSGAVPTEVVAWTLLKRRFR